MSEIETDIIHSVRDTKKQKGMVNNPIYQSSTVVFDSYEDFKHADNIYYNTSKPNPRELTYGRNGTETIFDCEELIAKIEGGDFCKVTSCGYSAIVVAINAFVANGDHILISDGVYGPTRKYADKVLSKFGVQVEYYDPCATYEQIKSQIKSNTKVIFCESPSSLTFEVQDIPAISRAAHESDITVILDNTWATPLYFRGFDKGADIVIESCTKYISGHSDFMMGAITFRERHFNAIMASFRLIGANTTPINAYYAMRGLRTMAARLAQHGASVTRVINGLANHPKISQILHPTQKNCNGHEIFKRDFLGHTALFSICLDKKYPTESLSRFFNNLKYFGMGYSWGGYESLIIEFPETMQAIRTATNRLYNEKTAIRIYIGLENPNDLLNDLLHCLALL